MVFTGIIETTAKILENRKSSLTLERPQMFDDIKVGSSVCVAGVCLTVVELDARMMRFDVVEETLAKSKLGELKKGEEVNVERAMGAGGRLDGHIVQGHVEGVAKIADGGLRELRVTLPWGLMKAVIEKGSIAIDGVSLTIASVKGNDIEIALVPHTLAITTLKHLKKGDRVNIETDILMRRHV